MVCPKCGSDSIEFKRETIGTQRVSSSTYGGGKHFRTGGRTSTQQIAHRTIGYCKNCGFTFAPNEPKKEIATWIVVVALIIFFPAGLVLTWMKKSWTQKTKIIITAVVVVLCIISVIVAPPASAALLL